ncbi:hypothetical protein V2A60_001815 [Cordyceps javanica]|uniref:DUF7053 domain-containing protein n=1 Tax=Cordyceps javanica TaxID=43265 RepID=A0A545VGC8_9HYPO|nr:hypothetical protein IF1G_00697 [Cordyceps javanica]TQW11946.1 hypothetical protein IF2G_00677 [Cordyceps javanica]
MSKKSTFTSVTPLPAGMTRQAAVSFLQDHRAMIDLNPLVTGRRQIPPPTHAQADELRCVWYEVTDRIAYLPGGLASGSVRYSCAFLDLDGVGLQTHCYAPMGVDLRTRWSVGGSAPGEPRERAELGVDAPPAGLYLREDTELRCGLVMAAFVRRTLRDSHSRLVERLTQRAAREVRDREHRERILLQPPTAAREQGPEQETEEQRERPGEGEQQQHRKNRVSSYYVQREAEATRRAAAALGTAMQYPRDADLQRNRHENQELQQSHAAGDGRTLSHGVNAGGASNGNNNNNYCGQQHYCQTQQVYEADVGRSVAELP